MSDIFNRYSYLVDQKDIEEMARVNESRKEQKNSPERGSKAPLINEGITKPSYGIYDLPSAKVDPQLAGQNYKDIFGKIDENRAADAASKMKLQSNESDDTVESESESSEVVNESTETEISPWQAAINEFKDSK